MNIESLDIETICDDNGVLKPLCIAITNGEKIDFKIIEIDDIDKGYILDFLLEKCSSKKIYYVHNLTFEIFVFLKEIMKREIKFKIIMSNMIVYSAEIEYNKKKIFLRCSQRLTLLSLDNLAKMAKIEEKKSFPYNLLDKKIKKIMIVKCEDFNSEEDFKNFVIENGEKVDMWDILKKYCSNDVIITKKAIIRFWQIIEENGMLFRKKNMLTAAKISVETYFKNYNIIKKKIPLKLDRVLRESYFGGRTEVFGNPIDGDVILHYDWSGMYAQAMQEKVLGGEIYQSNIIKDLSIPGFYWIEFIQELEFPILPIKLDKLMFVNGKLSGWYWYEEILLAMEYGVKIISVKKMIYGQYYDKFIEKFVENNNTIRKKDDLHKLIGKNNNNTFYGRLGMNPNRYEENILWKKDIENEKEYEKIIEKNGVYIGYKKMEKSISNITIASAITSKARIKLYKGMMEVMKNNGRILYTDTDSIIASFKNFDMLDKKMGEVIFDSNKKDTIIIDAVFALPKTYALKFKEKNSIVKIKGFKSTPDFEEFKEKFYKREFIETNNMQITKKNFEIKIENMVKRTNLYSLDKRKWKENLKSTEPYTYNNFKIMT